MKYSTYVTLVYKDCKLTNQAVKMSNNICNHFKFGFCKYKNKNECSKQHIEEMCQDRTTCRTKDCNLRHPRACKRYAIERFCRYGEHCAYFHVTDNTNDVTAQIQAAIKPYETKIERLEYEIQSLRAQVNSFCSLTQEAHEKFEDIETLKAQVTQLADKTYTLEENIEEAKKYSNDFESINWAQIEESLLKKSIDELKSEIEVLRTLNQETHYRIRLLEEEYEESQANESNDQESEEDQLQNENIKRNQNLSNDQGNLKMDKEETEANKHNNNKA